MAARAGVHRTRRAARKLLKQGIGLATMLDRDGEVVDEGQPEWKLFVHVGSASSESADNLRALAERLPGSRLVESRALLLLAPAEPEGC